MSSRIKKKKESEKKIVVTIDDEKCQCIQNETDSYIESEKK